ncbi:MAG: LPS export ABC transporter ATP-binding protein [Myxococcota bacterium]|nr:LPS export ABC transporter ATP-binding protein [Myxococcota bacterium]
MGANATAAGAVRYGAGLLEARGIRKRFGRREVLRGVDLDVGSGEVVGLLGPNGAGKTTAFRVLMGFLRADAGAVTLGGERIDGLAAHERALRGMAYLPQSACVLPGLSALDNVRLVLEERGFADAAALAAASIERTGLGAAAGQLAETLSGGERRRLEIARVLALRPSVVLLDEPFTGVDPLAVEDLRGRIRALRDDGIGALLTDHNVPEALRVCDRVAILADGVVAISGAADDVRRDPAAARLYLGSSGC